MAEMYRRKCPIRKYCVQSEFCAKASRVKETLPIHAVIPQLKVHLANTGVGVLIAPPGAGKTTAVAPALVNEAWCSGQIIITSPRRVAARAAAERMAEMLGEKAGETVGYQTRLDSRSSARTRILVVTEAIFVNRIIDDPELEGVSAILFDEAHERHLDSDFGLALALESRAVLREDLRILVMSATLDGGRFANLLGDDAAVIESEGKSFPLEIRWLGRNASVTIEDQMAAAVRQAWSDQKGDILAFLPGVREIERVRERLEMHLPDALVLPLHGQVEPAAQRAAIKRDSSSRRRIVLATAIAETSLTLDGVNIVVDSGLSRFAEFDNQAGTSRLVTRASSQAAATQRAGRAARQGPGIAYRLWEEAGHAGRPEFAAPEIALADLAPLLLRLAKWGSGDPKELAWLDPPADAALSTAQSTLQAMGALDRQGRLTDRGRKISTFSLDPVGAAIVLAGAEAGDALTAAKMVMLLQERGLGGRSEDMGQRLSRWDGDRSKRANSARKLADSWARTAEQLIKAESVADDDPALFLARARPSMIAKRRDKTGETWVSVAGRGYSLDPSSPLARAEWIVIGDAQGQARGARITAGAELSKSDIEQSFDAIIEKRSILHWNNEKNRVEPRLEKRLGEITIVGGSDPDPDKDDLVGILVEKALDRLGEMLPSDLLARARFAGLQELEFDKLRTSADLWLVPLLQSRRDLNIAPGDLASSILGMLDWNARKRLDEQAPRQFVSPAETHHAINYDGELAPSVEVRVQALFGLDQHPMIGPQDQSVPLTLLLTNPAGRPIGVTSDISGFWRSAWPDVVKDMKGRYPKHRWPDKPWAEKPSLKTKNAFNRD